MGVLVFESFIPLNCTSASSVSEHHLAAVRECAVSVCPFTPPLLPNLPLWVFKQGYMNNIKSESMHIGDVWFWQAASYGMLKTLEVYHGPS